MSPIQFIEGIRESVIESNLESYRAILSELKPGQIKDPYWIKLYNLYISLNEEHKQTLFQIIRQVEVDTVSKFLSILDGVSVLEIGSDEFKLTTVKNDSLINGDLQDIFLEYEEK